MKKLLLIICAMLLTASNMTAQRPTDVIDRGLVAIPASTNGGSGAGNFVSWRIFGEEYYDVTYNLYRDGSRIASNLQVSNYSDTGGTTASKYQVAAVVRGVEQAKSAAAGVWATGYYDVPAKPVYDRNGNDITTAQNYQLNDVSLGDIDGDGICEFIVKRNNNGNLRKTANKVAFNYYECYNLKGERLWRIDLGPNLMAEADEQWDIVLYDWDEDGKAELLMRGADNMIIYAADGSVIHVGNMNADTRWDDIKFTNSGAEYLLYMEGATAKPYDLAKRSTYDATTKVTKYQPMAYPLPRYDAGEPEDEAAIWGDGILGHRPTKHYFGAPFLDGRHASIFLGRGCYSRHKMVALDVNPTTHELTERWRWKCYDGGSPWFGNGFHNFAIADVDWDGRDEIITGSMVIDDNGRGLSTTGLGHGDAQHCGDFDPYRHGQEQFTCNETRPAMAYFNATTGEMYYRWQTSGDDGRALAGNFSNSFPGAMGRSTQTGLISCTADKPIVNCDVDIAWSDLNFRIYWDGDLLDEVLNSPGTEREAKIEKPGRGRIFTSSGCQMNNDSKNNPGVQGDILGDWREEIVVRAGQNLRIYTTPHPTQHRIYTLWHDHQYRNAMVWQCMGYNQPPHVSYFIGEFEGITIAPPPFMNNGRTEIANGGTIAAANNDQHVMLCETNDATITVAEGAAPYIFTDNAPSWVQGTDVDGTTNLTTNKAAINYQYFTHTVEGAAFSGSMRLVKQGDGILVLPAVEQTYTGPTDVWAGTLKFDGTLLTSDLWLNRFARLVSNGGQFKSVKMDYAAELLPGGEGTIGEVNIGTLSLGFGSRIVFDINSLDQTADHVTAQTLNIETKQWTYGPKYLEPVIELRPAEGQSVISEGRYLLGTFDTVNGKISDIVLEGVSDGKRGVITYDEGQLWLEVEGIRAADYIIWTGAQSNVWDFATSENFVLASDNQTATYFSQGDKVLIGNTATSNTIDAEGVLIADSVIFDHTRNYTLSGRGSISGTTVFVKRGSGQLTIQTDNDFTGGVRLSGGTTSVTSLANAQKSYGGLGGVNSAASKFIIENGAVLATTGAVQLDQPIYVQGKGGGIINKSAGFVNNGVVSGTKLTLRGSGYMQTSIAWNTLDTLVVEGGEMSMLGHKTPARYVELSGGALRESAEYVGSTYPIYVPRGKKGTLYLGNRCSNTNTITGGGTLTVVNDGVRGNGWIAARTTFAANTSKFEGTLVADAPSDWRYFTFRSTYGLPLGTLQIADNVEVQNSGVNFAIGKVQGDKGKLAGVEAAGGTAQGSANTWTIGNDKDWTWGGIVVYNSNLVKAGTGTATLNGASTHTGTTTINEGAIKISATTKLGTGKLTVEKNGTLIGVTGTSSLSNSQYDIKGTVHAGQTTTTTSGGINFGGNSVIFRSGSVYSVNIRKKATASSTGGTCIEGISTLSMGGTVRINLYAQNTLAEGDSVIIWKATRVTGTPKLENDTVNAAKNLFWNTDDIKLGILRVEHRTPVGIRGVSAETGEQPIYDLSGRQLGTTDAATLPRGIYIRGGKKFIVR